MKTWQKKLTLDPYPDDTRVSVIVDGARLGSVHRCGPRFMGRLASGQIIANCHSVEAAAQAVTDVTLSQERER
jgi:hypothetical protein